MARGSALSAQQVRDAIAFDRSRTAPPLAVLRTAFGMPSSGAADEAFVRAVADWQEDHIGAGEGDGRVGPKTEAHLNIQHPKAAKAVEKAKAIQKAGNILFDSWGNDVRDNDDDGEVDEKNEQTDDGVHFNQTFQSFGVITGTYTGLGWGHNKSLTVPKTVTVKGPFVYRVCADVVSRAYHEAGVMKAQRSTAMILQVFRENGFVWQKSEGYPSQFLPGDFVCTLGPHGGHSGIVVTGGPTDKVPTVIELPGPSTQVDLGTYDPTSTNDVRLGPWTKAGLTDLKVHFLGRLLLSKMP
jgi:hypothetical protein